MQTMIFLPFLIASIRGTISNSAQVSFTDDSGQSHSLEMPYSVLPGFQSSELNINSLVFRVEFEGCSLGRELSITKGFSAYFVAKKGCKVQEMIDEAISNEAAFVFVEVADYSLNESERLNIYKRPVFFLDEHYPRDYFLLGGSVNSKRLVSFAFSSVG